MNPTKPGSNTSTWPDLKNNLLSDSSQPAQASGSTLSPQYRWPDPRVSIGTPCSALGARKCWEVAGPAFHVSQVLLREVKGPLDQHSEYLHNVSTLFSISFGLFMIGKNENDTDPTLVISCERELTRIRCLNIIRRSGILTKSSGILLGSSSHSPTSLQPLRSRDVSSAADKDFVFFTPPKTNDVCGRSIHAIERTTLEGLCPTSISQKATIGGFVRLQRTGEDESYCGLTVAHVFKDGIQFPTAISRMDFTFDGDTSQSQDNTGDTMMNDGPDSHLLGHLSPIYQMIYVSFKERTYLNSVKDMDIVGVGNQLASSLNGQHPDLDSALIEVQRPHHEPANITSVDWVTGQYQLCVERVVTVITDAANVLAITSAGIQTGSISASSIFYKSPHGTSFEEVYVVRLDGRIGESDMRWTASGSS